MASREAEKYMKSFKEYLRADYDFVTISELGEAYDAGAVSRDEEVAAKVREIEILRHSLESYIKIVVGTEEEVRLLKESLEWALDNLSVVVFDSAYKRETVDIARARLAKPAGKVDTNAD
jgi:hypothetical protein